MLAMTSTNTYPHGDFMLGELLATIYMYLHQQDQYSYFGYYHHYTNLTFVSECVCESGRSTEAIRPEIITNL